MFKRATKENIKIRLALSGPSGSGKTYSALNVATGLGRKIAVIDTENHSSERYADLYEFDLCDLIEHSPIEYSKAIRFAAQAGYDVVIIDSLSHAWIEELNLAGKNFNNWKDIRPLERQLIQDILTYPGHIIATMRSKTEWVMEEFTNKRGQKTTSPKRVGTAAIQAQGIEYEFDIAGELNLEHTLTISKSRCSALAGREIIQPGPELAAELLAWAGQAEPASEAAFVPAKSSTPPPPAPPLSAIAPPTTIAATSEADPVPAEYSDSEIVGEDANLAVKSWRIAAGMESAQIVAMIKTINPQKKFPKELTYKELSALEKMIGAA